MSEIYVEKRALLEQRTYLYDIIVAVSSLVECLLSSAAAISSRYRSEQLRVENTFNLIPLSLKVLLKRFAFVFLPFTLPLLKYFFDRLSKICHNATTHANKRARDMYFVKLKCFSILFFANFSF